MNELREKNEKKDITIRKDSSNGITVDDHKYVFDLVNMWINNADSKVSTFCGLFTIAFGVLAFLVESIVFKRVVSAQVFNPTIMIPAILVICLGIIAFLLSLFYCFKTISPNLKGKSDETGESKDTVSKYSIFYGDIDRFDKKEEYIRVCDQCSMDDYRKNLIEEIHINSGICTKKMKNFRKGIWISFAALVLEVFGGVLLFFAFSP